MSVIVGAASITQSNEDLRQRVTADKFSEYLAGLHTLPMLNWKEIASGTTQANTTTRVVVLAATGARPGDLLLFTSGALAEKFAGVRSVATTAATLAFEMDGLTAGVGYLLLRVQPVSATNPISTSIVGSIPLPTGAATAALQSTLNANFGTFFDGFSNPYGFLMAGGVYNDAPAPLVLTQPGGAGYPGTAFGLLCSSYVHDKLGNGITSSTTAPAGTEQGLHVRQVGTVAATQSSTWTNRIQDSLGGSITAVPDQVWSTGVSSLPAMGYDYNNGSWGVLPLNYGATAVPVELLSNAVTIAPTVTSVIGTITTATSTVQNSSIGGYGGVSILVRGTYNGVNFTPEVSSDGTNWSTVSMSRQDTPQIQQSSGAITNTIRAWIAPTLGCSHFRVRATAWVSGTMTVVIAPSFAAVPTAVQTIPSGTQTISGAVTVTGPVSLTASKTAGGATHYRNINLDNTGALVHAGQTYVSSLEAFNTTGATIYLKIYNKATIATSADTPIKTIPIAANSERDITSSIGWNIALGFSVRCVTGVADADTTSPAANGCVFSCTYT